MVKVAKFFLSCTMLDAIITDKSLSKEYLDKLKNRNAEVITPKNDE